MLEFSGLEGKQNQITGSLPGGWKQRVAFGAAIMHEPSVLFLDEPTSGVDPLARRAFWRMINQLADVGAAILVTTHYLEEAEQCNRLGFMVAGELVAEGTPSGIKSRAGRPSAGIDRGPAAARRGPVEEERTLARFAVRRPAARDHGRATRRPGERSSSKLKARACTCGRRVKSSFSLEDVFISVVEKARQQARSPRRIDDAANIRTSTQGTDAVGRDRLALALALVLPLVQLVLLGTAIALTVSDLPSSCRIWTIPPHRGALSDAFRASIRFTWFPGRRTSPERPARITRRAPR